MKVDFIIGRLAKGGAERVMVALSAHFVKKGHKVRIITLDHSKDAYDLDPSIKRIRVARKSFPIIKVRNILNLTSFYSKKSERPDIAISFLTSTNLAAILSCSFRGIPIIASEHNNHLFVPNPKWLVRLNWRYVYRKARFLTVLTDFDVDFFKKRKANVVVMPNPCSFEVLSSNEHVREKTVIAVGNLNRIYHKGFDNLIEIMSPILKRHPEWKLKIVGGGDEGRTTLEKLASESGAGGQIEFMGFQKNVSEIMQRTSVFILSSRYEGLPMVLLEAMSQGMACVAYDCITGPSNMIQDHKNGILVKDQDIPSMQHEVEKLMTDEPLRKRLGDTAIKSLDDYSIERIYERWEDLLNQIKSG